MNDLKELAEKVLAWWEEHQYDTTQDTYGDQWNVYDETPKFVIAAKDALNKLRDNKK